jgi:hypothetical protein
MNVSVVESTLGGLSGMLDVIFSLWIPDWDPEVP